MSLRIIAAAQALCRTHTPKTQKAALAELRRVVMDLDFVSDVELKRAMAEYCECSDNTIEVDEGAIGSRADDGVWVNAWLWLQNEENTQ